jgi:hypothetical protein
VLAGGDLERPKVSNFLEGNLLFDIEVVKTEQITEFYERLYELSSVDVDGQTRISLRSVLAIVMDSACRLGSKSPMLR